MFAVIQKSIYWFLQHPLFIADNDIRRAQLHKTFETIIPIYDATVKVIKVWGCESTAIKSNKRT